MLQLMKKYCKMLFSLQTQEVSKLIKLTIWNYTWFSDHTHTHTHIHENNMDSKCFTINSNFISHGATLHKRKTIGTITKI